MECSLLSMKVGMIGQTMLKSRVSFRGFLYFLCSSFNMFTLTLPLVQQEVLEVSYA